MTPPLVLASSSPYRQALLQRLGLEFTAQAPDVDETPRPGEPPGRLVARLAQAKAAAVAAHHPASLVIASDQVAELDEHILGKPGSHERAITQLQAVSGRSVRFLTSLALLNTATGRCQLEIVPYTVHFRALDMAQIKRYLHRERPYHCAGSFKAEGFGVVLFERLEGDDPNALIGLPLIRLVRMLEREGVMLP